MSQRKTLCQALIKVARELTIPVALGVAGGLWAGAETDNYLMKRDLKKPIATQIDRDNIPDLVIGRRIYLAEPNGEYRRLTKSDIYRIR